MKKYVLHYQNYVIFWNIHMCWNKVKSVYMEVCTLLSLLMSFHAFMELWYRLISGPSDKRAYGLFIHPDQYWSALKGAHWFNVYGPTADEMSM